MTSLASLRVHRCQGKIGLTSESNDGIASLRVGYEDVKSRLEKNIGVAEGWSIEYLQLLCAGYQANAKDDSGLFIGNMQRNGAHDLPCRYMAES